MKPTEERAVLERAAKVCETSYTKIVTGGPTFEGQEFAAAIRSLPLESKESEAEPVAWMTDRGNLLHRSIIEFLRQNNIYAAERFNIPLYLHPAECPKCAEYERMENTLLEAHQCEKQRAEAAEARADKWQSAYAKEFDIRNGTPCEQIRWQQTLDDTRENLANVQVQLDDCGALARRLTYALKRSHTNDELCKQSVDLLKRLGQGGQIVRAK